MITARIGLKSTNTFVGVLISMGSSVVVSLLLFLFFIPVSRFTGWALVYFAIVLVYMLVELLLDYVFKVDFRARRLTHIPYIILEYIALFGLIGIAFDVDWMWGFVVSISFWILLACLIYLYWGGRRQRDKG